MNVDSLFHLPSPLRRAAYFGLQRAIGSRVLARWRELGRWERLAPAELNQTADARLAELLHHSLRHSAYYRSLAITPAPREPARALLQRFPILTRENLRARFLDLVIDPLRREINSPSSVCPKRYGWIIVKTGGTTGAPTTVVHDAAFRDWGRATRLYSQRLCGFPLGARYFRLWGSEQDLLDQKEKLDRRILRNLLGEIPLNAFRAKENELLRHWQTLRDNPKIHHLMAYVDAAVSLAQYIEERRLERPRLKTLMACAGTVTPEWRRILTETYQTDVLDKYGSRECADIACECSHHTGLHIYSPNIFLEVVDEAGLPCPPGQTGRILITLLNNLSFPMIRYQIGDCGVLAEDTPCPCGIPFPRLQSLQGREDDMLTTADGTSLSSVFVRHFVGVSLNRQLIRDWQLEQAAPNRFVFRYVPHAARGLENNLEELKQSFLKAFGAGAVIELRQVKEIPPSATGKIRWVINTVPKTKYQPPDLGS